MYFITSEPLCAVYKTYTYIRFRFMIRNNITYIRRTRLFSIVLYVEKSPQLASYVCILHINILYLRYYESSERGVEVL